MWRAVRAGLMMVVVVGLAMGGLALAQDDGSRDRQPFVPHGAYERILDLLAPLVDDGTLTEDQAAAVADRLSDRLPARRPQHDHPARMLADELGVTPAELREAADAEQSLADVAAARGVTAAELVDRFVAPLQERLADAVAEGDLSEDEAAARLDQAKEHVSDRVARPLRDLRRDRPRDRPRDR